MFRHQRTRCNPAGVFQFYFEALDAYINYLRRGEVEGRSRFCCQWCMLDVGRPILPLFSVIHPFSPLSPPRTISNLTWTNPPPCNPMMCGKQCFQLLFQSTIFMQHAQIFKCGHHHRDSNMLVSSQTPPISLDNHSFGTHCWKDSSASSSSVHNDLSTWHVQAYFYNLHFLISFSWFQLIYDSPSNLI